MPFTLLLQKLVDAIPHAIGAILIDWEGEAVQEFCHCDPYDLRFVAAHNGILLARLKELHAGMDAGIINDMCITTTTMHMIIGSVDSEYALVMMIGRGCPSGQALVHFRSALIRFREEL